MLSLNNLKPTKGTTTKKKRIGRGNASGHGSYSTRGAKGQKARSGVSGLTKMSLKKMILSTPKSRGFKSLKPKNQVVNLSVINKKFKDADKINPATLFKAGLIAKSGLPVKILGKDGLTLKSLLFEKLTISGQAREQIEKMGGKIK